MPTTYDITGLRGPQGPSGTITNATATSLAYGSTPTVTLGGTPEARTMQFNIPQGQQGPPGPSGGFIIRHKYSSFNAWQADTDPVNNYGFNVGDLGLIGGNENATEYGRVYLYKGANNGDTGQNNAWQFIIDFSVQGIEGQAATIILDPTQLVVDDPADAGVVNNGNDNAAVLQFSIPRGPTGNTGRGVSTVTQPSGDTSFRFTFSDNTTQDVTLPAGPTGPSGANITDVSLQVDAENTSQYKITFDLTDNTTRDVNFPIPAPGTAATVDLASTHTALAAGATPTVTNQGDTTNAVFQFGIPAGADGGPGPQGDNIASVSIVEDPQDSTKWQLTLTLDDANSTALTPVSFDKPADGADGVSVTGVNSVDVDTINFSLSNNTTTSDIDLPRGLQGPSGTLAVLSTTTVASGNNAAVTVDGTSTFSSPGIATHAKLNFSVPKGRGFTSVAIADNPNDNTQYRLTFTSDDSTTSTDTVDFDKPTNGTNGTGFTGGSYSPSTGIVTFTSNDGLGFSTQDLRGADGADGSTTLNDLDNVDLATNAPTSGQILKYDGTNFVPAADQSVIYAIALG